MLGARLPVDLAMVPTIRELPCFLAGKVTQQEGLWTFWISH